VAEEIVQGHDKRWIAFLKKFLQYSKKVQKPLPDITGVRTLLMTPLFWSPANSALELFS